MNLLVTIKSYSNPITANLDRAKLESAGIKCFLMDENMVSILPIYSLALGNIKLKVHKRESLQAEKVLGNENPPLFDNFKLRSENENSSQLKCPCCLSLNIYRQSYSRKSLLSMLLVGFPVPIFSPRFHCFDCGFEWKRKGKT